MLRFFRDSGQRDSPAATGCKDPYCHFPVTHAGTRIWRSEQSMMGTAPSLPVCLLRACISGAYADKAESRARRLDSPHQDQYDDDKHDETQATGWTVAPLPVVRPTWDRADQQQDEYHQDDGANGHFDSPWDR